ncbi:hypothetical protein ACFOG5_12090 [Pedobacter fastidiosus]|uniref:Uncharacterized protein n=1 Tax=Pedobacter fastidiosus TaxID=2765361 RepID=A0ABR7KWU6_9SPHI|nr:hypothetical protein [Pedobacter fastidiosus]MBC6112510.1 hypothetical protein [Pedobacter fastidiosus]
MFSNLNFTFVHIRKTGLILESLSKKEIQKPLPEQHLNYLFLFNDEYICHATAFDEILVELKYANNIQWFGKKSYARLYYNVLVKYGIMKKLGIEDVAKCFATRFSGILYTTFKGVEDNAYEEERIEMEIQHKFRMFPGLSFHKIIEFHNKNQSL